MINYVYVQRCLPKALYHLNHDMKPVQQQQPVYPCLPCCRQGSLSSCKRRADSRFSWNSSTTIRERLRLPYGWCMLMSCQKTPKKTKAQSPATAPNKKKNATHSCHSGLQKATFLRIVRRVSAIPLVPSPSCKGWSGGNRFKSQPKVSRFTERIYTELWLIILICIDSIWLYV